MLMSKFINMVGTKAASCMEDLYVIMEKSLFKCPICKRELHYEGLRHLETLSEHVSDPNSLPVEKFLFVCKTHRCPANILGLGWSSTGAVYTLGVYFPIHYLKGENSELAAIGSLSWKQAKEKEYKKSRTKEFHIGRSKGHYHPITVRFSFIYNPLKWEFSYIRYGIFKVYEFSIYKKLLKYYYTLKL